MRFAEYYNANQPLLQELAGMIEARARAAGGLVVRQESPYAENLFAEGKPVDRRFAARMMQERLQFTSAVGFDAGSRLQQVLYADPPGFFAGPTVLRQTSRALVQGGQVIHADYAYESRDGELLGHTYRVERDSDSCSDQVSLMVIDGLVRHIQHDALSFTERSAPVPIFTVPMTTTLPPPSPEGLKAIRGIIER